MLNNYMTPLHAELRNPLVMGDAPSSRYSSTVPSPRPARYLITMQGGGGGGGGPVQFRPRDIRVRSVKKC